MAKKMQHTPGPWTAIQGDIEVYVSRDNNHGGDICRMALTTPDDHRMANARLIAQAPRMLTLLSRLERILSRDETEPDPLKYAELKRGTYQIADEARAILREVEGQEIPDHVAWPPRPRI